MSYNGWKNYETWLVNLWIDNDGGAEYWRERALEKFNITNYDVLARGPQSLADEMQAYYTELAEQVIPSQGMFADLFSSALREVCWYDIASHYINESTAEAA